MTTSRKISVTARWSNQSWSRGYPDRHRKGDGLRPAAFLSRVKNPHQCCCSSAIRAVIRPITAIASFCNLDGKKVAIIGGMHELGADERNEHEKLVEQLEACGLEQCLLVGPEFEGIALQPNMHLFPDTPTLRSWLEQHHVEGCTVLVKGSNTNRLWELEELL